MKKLTLLAACALLCTLPFSNALAQADLGLKGGGVEFGIVGPDNVDTTIGFGLFLDLGTIAPNFMVESYVDYWWKSENDFNVETYARDLVVGGKVKYAIPMEHARLRPFAGAGVGIHFFKGEVTVPDQFIGGSLVPGYRIEDTSVKPGLDIGAGMATVLNHRTQFIAEAWYAFVSDINQVSLKAGILYAFN